MEKLEKEKHESQEGAVVHGGKSVIKEETSPHAIYCQQVNKLKEWERATEDVTVTASIEWLG